MKYILNYIDKNICTISSRNSHNKQADFDISITAHICENIFRNMTTLSIRNYVVHLRKNYKHYLISVLILYLIRIFFFKDISVNTNVKKESNENPKRLRKP